MRPPGHAKWDAVMQREPVIVMEVIQNICLEHEKDQRSFGWYALSSQASEG
jgi:hypothetical protein